MKARYSVYGWGDGLQFHSRHGVFDVFRCPDPVEWGFQFTLVWGEGPDGWAPYYTGDGECGVFHHDILKAPKEGLEEAKEYVIALHNLES